MKKEKDTYQMFSVCNIFFETVPVGTKVWLGEDKRPFTVRATNRFYSILTKPYNPQKTVLYTIVDWRNKVNNRENLIFGLGAETDEECQEMLERVTNGESNLSHRGLANLDVRKIKLPFLPFRN